MSYIQYRPTSVSDCLRMCCNYCDLKPHVEIFQMLETRALIK